MELGCNALEFIAMASKEDLDANAEFIRLADSYVEVPAGKNTFNYANVDLICEIARKKKVGPFWCIALAILLAICIEIDTVIVS